MLAAFGVVGKVLHTHGGFQSKSTNLHRVAAGVATKQRDVFMGCKSQMILGFFCGLVSAFLSGGWQVTQRF